MVDNMFISSSIHQFMPNMNRIIDVKVDSEFQIDTSSRVP